MASRWSGVGVGAILIFFTAVGVCVVANRKLLVRGGVVVTVFLFFYVDWVGWLVGLSITKRCERSVGEWGWRWYR